MIPPAPLMIALAAVALTLIGVVLGGALVLWRITSADRRRRTYQRAGDRQSVGLRGEVQGATVHVAGGTAR